MLVRVLSSAAGVSSEGDGVGAAGANGGGLCHACVPPLAAATAERFAMMKCMTNTTLNKCMMNITLLVRVLYSLCKVLLQLEKEMILVSSLRSVTCLVQQHYRKLEGEEGKGKNEEGEEEMEEKEEEEGEKEEGQEEQEEGDGDTRTGRQNLDSQAESSDLEPGEVTTKSLHSMSTSGEGNGDMREGVPGRDQSQRSPGEHGSIVCQTGDPGEVGQYSWDTLTVHSAAVQTLEFVQPFVEDIHHQYCSVNMVSELCACTRGTMHYWQVLLCSIAAVVLLEWEAERVHHLVS